MGCGYKEGGPGFCLALPEDLGTPTQIPYSHPILEKKLSKPSPPPLPHRSTCLSAPVSPPPSPAKAAAFKEAVSLLDPRLGLNCPNGPPLC